MIGVSDAWKDIHQRLLLPETFIEIDCTLTEVGAQEVTTASGTNEAIFSDIESIRGLSDTTTKAKYATLELNLWPLDGTETILPDSGPYPNAGYVSNIAESGSVALTMPEVHSALLPGVTITWSSEYEEYPVVFTVTAYNGDTVVAETTITDNASYQSVVDLEISNYDRVEVTVHNWCLPGHRARVDKLLLGHILTFTKADVISCTHTQHGDLLTGELPKYSLEFALDNTNAQWNPNNPLGTGKYLSERQRVIVRYGMDVGGTTEWIKAGTFYLSEWNAPSNGFEARFVARDMFEYLISVENKASVYDNLANMIKWATGGLLPEGSVVDIDPSLANYTAEYLGDGTAAEIVQKCANAACCILRCDRNGALHIEPLDNTLTEFVIPLSLAYTYPEIALSKPLKTVLVDYGDDNPYELVVTDSGEKQTVGNSFVSTEAQAALVAEWVRDVLQTRKTVSGEFRADPRLDLFDVVTVQTKYGDLSPVVITDIKYSYTGAFRASYTGRVIT